MVAATPLLAGAETEATTELIAEEIGWTFRYPNDWKVLSDVEIAVLEGRGEVAMEETLDTEIIGGHRNILYLRKDTINLFTASVEPFDPAYGPYPAQRNEVFRSLVETYLAAGLEIVHDTGSEQIDGLEFFTLNVTVFKPGTREVLMHQTMYDRLFGNGVSLLISLNWNNERDLTTLRQMLESSSFPVRD